MNNNMPVINISKNIKDNPLEVWVKIKNYPKYEVSNLGRIISYNNKNPRLLNGSIRCGYKVVDLWNEDGNTGNILLHRIVAETFIPKIEGKDFVDHIDGNKLNNKVTNLRWVTKKENYHNVNTINNVLNALNKNIRLIGDEHHIGDNFEFVIYKVQIKVLWFWVTIKEFDEDEYYDAVDCFRYCTNPYIN